MMTGVIVLNDNQQQSALLAYDAATGALAWRTPRDHGQAMVRSSFSTPFIAVVRDGLFIRTATRLYRVGRPDA
jgi:hypothetical protein